MYYTNAVRRGDNILVRGISNGKAFKNKVPYKPTLFINTTNFNSKYKDIYGKPCGAVKFDSMKDAIEWQKENKHTCDVLGMDNFVLAYLGDTYPNDIEFDLAEIRICIIDIEVSAPEFPNPLHSKYPIDALTLYDSIRDTYYVWGVKPWSEKKSELDQSILDKVEYTHCTSEKDLLARFIMHWHSACPDVISGWNSDDFDMPYVHGRLMKVLGEGAANRLSPWEVVTVRDDKDQFGNLRLKINIYGVAMLDYLALYRKFTYTTRAFYKLGYIAQCELDDNKLEFEGSHEALAQENYQKYIDYNIKDVWIVKKLEEKLNLFSVAIGMAYAAKINYDDAFGPVKMWDAIIFNELKQQHVVIPKNRRSERQPFEGAYVKEPVPGFYEWMISFDLTSLHPMLMNQYNISPETKRGRAEWVSIDDYVNKVAVVKEPEFATAANGVLYTKEFKGVIPSVALKVFNKRVHHKGLQQEFKSKAKVESDPVKKAEYTKRAVLENVRQMAYKYSINSLYGSLGSPYFRYYDLDNAEAVTVSSQLVNRWIERKINEYLNSIIPGPAKSRSVAGDTDSNYFTFKDVVDTFPAFKGKSKPEIVEMLDQFAEKKIIPVINAATAELAEYMNAYDNFMTMKREAIASTGFWTAKKRYALDVWDMEGIRYKEPEIKITGLETVKSSTPKFCIPALEHCIEIILRNDNSKLLSYINQFEKEFSTRDYREIASITSVNNIRKYSDANGFPMKGATAQVKGALAYNRLKLKDRINDGDKVGLLPLKLPNKFNSPIIAYTSEGLSDDLKESVTAVIDYNALYAKTFLAPLELMTKAVGWKTEDTNDLLSFFE